MGEKRDVKSTEGGYRTCGTTSRVRRDSGSVGVKGGRVTTLVVVIGLILRSSVYL